MAVNVGNVEKIIKKRFLLKKNPVPLFPFVILFHKKKNSKLDRIIIDHVINCMILTVL